MIRRISKVNDLKDIIKSCPSGVIDDIYDILYYVQGYNIYISATFTKVNNVLEVIIPSESLQTLPNGILMRKAYYKVEDSSYPDGYYNLEFVDNMNIWLGEDNGETPVEPQYATKDWVSENFLENSKIWTGTQEQWEQLTSEQQASYTIALVTE